jgi:SAM-dependent methyltransferase
MKYSRPRPAAPEAPSAVSTNAEYWSRHNVTAHRRFASREDSLAYFRWRQLQYLFNDDSLPYGELSGKVVLDFGCGPGDDLVGIVEQSEPARLIGADVSPTSLSEAHDRLALHGPACVEFVLLREGERLPLEDDSVDVVVSMGVLHHVPALTEVLLELGRVLRADGVIHAMVYNRNSIWAHLYVPYLRQIVELVDSELPFEEAFRRSTDGPECPHSVAFTREQFADAASRAGLTSTLKGAAVSLSELRWLERRLDALEDQRLPPPDREFLAHLTFDEHGRPLSEGVVAGIDTYYELRHARQPARASW